MPTSEELRKRENEQIVWRYDRQHQICQWINEVDKLTPEGDRRILGAMLWRVWYASSVPSGNYVSGSGIAHGIRMNLREWDRIEQNLVNNPAHLEQAKLGMEEWMVREKAIDLAKLGELKVVIRIEDVIGEKYALKPRSGSDRLLVDAIGEHIYVDPVAQTYQCMKWNEFGDVVCWLMKRNGWNFLQAVDSLKWRAARKEKEKESNG